MTDDLQDFARAVRHEANNLFAALMGTIEILQRAATTDRDLARAERMREATTRLEALLKGYLSLAAPPREDGGTDGPKVLELLRPLLVLLLGPGRTVEIEAPPRLRRVAMPVEELQATIIRLARQAVVAVPPRGGLRVVMEAAPAGVSLTITPLPDGKGPQPVFLPAA